jgi:hypothetical protein
VRDWRLNGRKNNTILTKREGRIAETAAGKKRKILPSCLASREILEERIMFLFLELDPLQRIQHGRVTF